MRRNLDNQKCRHGGIGSLFVLYIDMSGHCSSSLATVANTQNGNHLSGGTASLTASFRQISHSKSLPSHIHSHDAPALQTQLSGIKSLLPRSTHAASTTDSQPRAANSHSVVRNLPSPTCSDAATRQAVSAWPGLSDSPRTAFHSQQDRGLSPHKCSTGNDTRHTDAPPLLRCDSPACIGEFKCISPVPYMLSVASWLRSIPGAWCQRALHGLQDLSYFSCHSCA